MTSMHNDEVQTDEALVRSLLDAQMPQWAHLPITRLASIGTDHAVYRLGEALSVRLPRIAWAAAQPAREWEWLPRLAPHLPVPIPVPLAKGQPAAGYPFAWVVSPWMPGEDATPGRAASAEVALDLARFVSALQRIDPAGAPPPGPQNFFRGVPLSERDGRLRDAFPHWHGVLDTAALVRAWDHALGAPAWSGRPVWLHGDLSAGNVLVERGRLAAVIDFGCMGAGDPACDMSVAWTILSREGRRLFREALAPDDATWARARGWAMMGAGALPYYAETFPAQVMRARRALEEVLADFACDKEHTS